MNVFSLDRRYFIVVTLILALFLVAACGGGAPEETPTTEPEATTAPVATSPPPATTAPTNTPSPTNTPIPTAVPAPTNTPGPEPTIDLEAARSNVPPQIFVGTAKIDGVLAAPGTIVAARIGETEVALAVVESNGVFTPLKVSFLNQTVNFTVGGFAATQTARTSQGGGTKLDLTAASN